jgi:chaperonin GroES
MIRPLEDKVVVQPNKDTEAVTSSGLIITGGNDSPTETATVIAVGNGITLQNGTHIPLSVNVGDTVMYSAFAGTNVEHDSENYLILPYRDIMAVIEND